MKYSNYFNFGVVRKPSQEITQNFQIKQLPTILVMIATEGKHEGKKILQFSSVFYEPKLYGEISYVNLTRFFYSVHEKHWAEHPDAKEYKRKLGLRELFADDVRKVLTKDSQGFPSEDEDDAIEEEMGKEGKLIEITYQNHKRMCTESALGLCLIYFLDAESERGVKKALKLYEDLQQTSRIKGLS